MQVAAQAPPFVLLRPKQMCRKPPQRFLGGLQPPLSRNARGHFPAQVFVRLRQCLISQRARRGVARDFDESSQLAVPVARRCNHHVGPKPIAVLAKSPAFLFEAALLGGGGQRQLGLPGYARVRRVEGREVLSDDFIG